MGKNKGFCCLQSNLAIFQLHYISLWVGIKFFGISCHILQFFGYIVTTRLHEGRKTGQ